MEYAQSLILSRNREPVVKHATERAIEQFVNLINDIILDVIVYFAISFAEEEMGMNEFRLRLKSISAISTAGTSTSFISEVQKRNIPPKIATIGKSNVES